MKRSFTHDGAGTVAIAQVPSNAFQSLMGRLKNQEASDEGNKTIASLNRLAQLLDKLDHGDLMARAPRTPARELEQILGALNPINLGLVEPFKRFEAGVNAVHEKLMKRDSISDNKLVAIRMAIARTLERGDWGPLEPLERDCASCVPSRAPAAAGKGVTFAEGPTAAVEAAAAGPVATKLSDTELWRTRKMERETVEFGVNDIVLGSYERQSERELLLSGLHKWFDSATADFAEALEAIVEEGDTREHQTPLGGIGQVEESLNRQPYHHQKEFDAQLLIEKGRAQFDGLIGRLDEGAHRARELHEQLASGMKKQIALLEVQLAQAELDASPGKGEMQALQAEKEELQKALRQTEAILSINQHEAEVAKKQLLETGALLEGRGQELRRALAGEARAKEMAETHKVVVQQKDVELLEMQRKLDSMYDELQDAVNAERAHDSELEQLKETQCELEKQLGAAQKELMASENIVPPAVRTRLDGLQSEVETLRKELKAERAEKADISSKYEAVEEKRKDAAAAEAARAAVEKEAETARAMLEVEKKRLQSQAQKMADSLRAAEERLTAMGDLDEKLAHAEERAMEAEAKRGEALDRCAEAAERAEIMEARAIHAEKAFEEERQKVAKTGTSSSSANLDRCPAEEFELRIASSAEERAVAIAAKREAMKSSDFAAFATSVRAQVEATLTTAEREMNGRIYGVLGQQVKRLDAINKRLPIEWRGLIATTQLQRARLEQMQKQVFTADSIRVAGAAEACTETDRVHDCEAEKEECKALCASHQAERSQQDDVAASSNLQADSPSLARSHASTPLAGMLSAEGSRKGTAEGGIHESTPTLPLPLPPPEPSTAAASASVEAAADRGVSPAAALRRERGSSQGIATGPAAAELAVAAGPPPAAAEASGFERPYNAPVESRGVSSGPLPPTTERAVSTGMPPCASVSEMLPTGHPQPPAGSRCMDVADRVVGQIDCVAYEDCAAEENADLRQEIRILKEPLESEATPDAPRHCLTTASRAPAVKLVALAPEKTRADLLALLHSAETALEDAVHAHRQEEGKAKEEMKTARRENFLLRLLLVSTMNSVVAERQKAEELAAAAATVSSSQPLSSTVDVNDRAVPAGDPLPDVSDRARSIDPSNGVGVGDLAVSGKAQGPEPSTFGTTRLTLDQGAPAGMKKPRWFAVPPAPVSTPDPGAGQLATLTTTFEVVDPAGNVIVATGDGHAGATIRLDPIRIPAAPQPDTPQQYDLRLSVCGVAASAALVVPASAKEGSSPRKGAESSASRRPSTDMQTQTEMPLAEMPLAEMPRQLAQSKSSVVDSAENLRRVTADFQTRLEAALSQAKDANTSALRSEDRAKTTERRLESTFRELNSLRSSETALKKEMGELSSQMQLESETQAATIAGLRKELAEHAVVKGSAAGPGPGSDSKKGALKKKPAYLSPSPLKERRKRLVMATIAAKEAGGEDEDPTNAVVTEEIAAAKAMAALYGIEPALLNKITSDVGVLELAVPLGQLNQQHIRRVVASATAAVLAFEGGVSMPPSPPAFARSVNSAGVGHDEAIRAAAEAAYELQCASPSRGASRAGSRVPDFYRAWMEEQLHGHGCGAFARADASARAVAFPHGCFPPFLASSGPNSSHRFEGIQGLPPATKNKPLAAEPRARHLPSSRDSVPPSPTTTLQRNLQVMPDQQQTSRAHALGLSPLQTGYASTLVAPPPGAASTSQPTLGRSRSCAATDGRQSLPPWLPQRTSYLDRPLYTSASTGAAGGSHARSPNKQPLAGLREQVAPMLVSLNEHSDENVRAAARRIMQEIDCVARPPAYGDDTDLQWQPLCLDADALAAAGAPPRALRAASMLKEHSARLRNRGPPSQGQSASNPEVARRSEGRLANGCPANVAAKRVQSLGHGSNRVFGSVSNSNSVRTALGPVYDMSGADVAAAACALTHALHLLGPEFLPLHGVFPVVARLFDSGDLMVRDAACALVHTLMRAHGEQAVLGPLASALGNKTLAALRRSQPPPAPAPTIDPPALTSAVSDLIMSFTAFGASSFDVAALVQHPEAVVRTAADKLLNEWIAAQADTPAWNLQQRSRGISPGTPAVVGKGRSASGQVGPNLQRVGVAIAQAPPQVKKDMSSSERLMGFAKTARSEKKQQQVAVNTVLVGPSPTNIRPNLAPPPMTPNAPVGCMTIPDDLAPPPKGLGPAPPAAGSTRELVAPATPPAAASRAGLTAEGDGTRESAAPATRTPVAAATRPFTASVADACATQPFDASPLQAHTRNSPTLEMAGTAFGVFSPLSKPLASRPTILPSPQQPVGGFFNAPPMDRSLRADLNSHEHAALSQALEHDGAAQLEFINIAQSARGTILSFPGAPVAAGYGCSPGPRPITSESLCRREIAASASASQLQIDGQRHDDIGANCGENPYLQKLPPVLRRSVSGTGPQLHAQAVRDGTRRPDGTPSTVRPELPSADWPPERRSPPPKLKTSQAEMLTKVYAL